MTTLDTFNNKLQFHLYIKINKQKIKKNIIKILGCDHNLHIDLTLKKINQALHLPVQTF